MRKISVAGFLRPKSGSNGKDGSVVDLGFLKGKRIIGAGLLDFEQLGDEDGRFAVDYEDNGKTMRAVFSYSDQGIWLEWKGEKGKVSPEDEVYKKIHDAWPLLDKGREKKTLTVVGDALLRQYAFMNGKRKILSLGCSEIKLMGKDVSRHFRGEMKVDDLLESIRTWCFQQI